MPWLRDEVQPRGGICEGNRCDICVVAMSLSRPCTIVKFVGPFLFLSLFTCMLKIRGRDGGDSMFGIRIASETLEPTGLFRGRCLSVELEKSMENTERITARLFHQGSWLNLCLDKQPRFAGEREVRNVTWILSTRRVQSCAPVGYDFHESTSSSAPICVMLKSQTGDEESTMRNICCCGFVGVGIVILLWCMS